MNAGVLRSETIHYIFNGKRHSFRVDELEEGYWRIECGHGLFKEAIGGHEIPRAESVDDALDDLRQVYPELGKAMQEAYDKVSRQHIAAYQGWVRDRRTFFIMN